MGDMLRENVPANDMEYVFGLDIGTRNVVGTVGYMEDETFKVLGQVVREHKSRSMIDGQIHDIEKVARVIREVKEALEEKTRLSLNTVCIAAAGRVLRTVTTNISYEYEKESVVTGEDLYTLDLMGVDKAHRELSEEDDKFKYYCVGYTAVKQYLNGDVFSSLEGHKALKIEEELIVTFLPEDVVDGLYTAVERADLKVANLTLEPIAAINVAIPESYRMLNISLVDVGAGTSDICITKEGAIIAYGMIPYAGDEITEVLVQKYLVDFANAELIKKQAAEGGDVVYEDIMGLTHTISSAEVHEECAEVLDKITTAISEKILELNGGNPVAAVFVVGGGGKAFGFCDAISKKLSIIDERVALRGEEVLKMVDFSEQDVKKDPLLVTPIGICLNYYEQRNSFIMVRFNGELIKIYDNGNLKVVDAALQAGLSTEELFPKRGKEIRFKVNGVPRMEKGESGDSAKVYMNGREVGLNDMLHPNSDITVEFSTAGEGATLRIEDLPEFANTSYVDFIVNGKRVHAPRFVEVNGKLATGEYEIKNGDDVETRAFYTVGQLAEFMDVVLMEDHEILVNNRTGNMDSIIYENFSVEWTVDEFAIPPSELREMEEEAEQVEAEVPDEAEAVVEPEVQDEVSAEAEASQEPMEAEAEEVAEAPEEASEAESEAQETAKVEAAGEAEESTEEAEVAKEAKEEDSSSEETAEAETKDEVAEAEAGEVVAEAGESVETKDEVAEAKSEEPAETKGSETNTDINMDGIVDTSERSFREEVEAMHQAQVEREEKREEKVKSEIMKRTLFFEEEKPEKCQIKVKVNDTEIVLRDKSEYIFVDIYNYYEFNTESAKGKKVVTKINGKECSFADVLHDGDVIDLFWKDRHAAVL